MTIVDQWKIPILLYIVSVKDTVTVMYVYFKHGSEMRLLVLMCFVIHRSICCRCLVCSLFIKHQTVRVKSGWKLYNMYIYNAICVIFVFYIYIYILISKFVSCLFFKIIISVYCHIFVLAFTICSLLIWNHYLIVIPDWIVVTNHENIFA